MLGYIIVMIVGMVVSGATALWVRSSCSKYSKQRSASGLVGAQVARMILDRNGLSNVRVEPVAGQLTDHYDPRGKVVRLSEGNFSKNSIAAVSVAAHECGHAIQDASGYLPMKLRAGLFPIVMFSSQIWVPLFIFAIIMGVGTATGQFLIQLAAISFLAVLAFHVVTLPVEVNASTRAYGLLTRYGILSGSVGFGHPPLINGGGLHLHCSGADRVLDAPVLAVLEPKQRIAGCSRFRRKRRKEYT